MKNPNPHGAPTFIESELMAAEEPTRWTEPVGRVFFAAVAAVGSTVAAAVVWGLQHLGGHA